MNILFIAPYVPSRIRVRPFHIIKELSKRHKVTVVALGEVDGHKTQATEDLLDFVHDLHVIPHSKLRGFSQSLMALSTPIPMCTAFCRSKLMELDIANLMTHNKFDLIHVEHLRGAHFVPKNIDIPVVFDSVDCLTGLFRQMSKTKNNPVGKLVMMEEAFKLKRYEPKMIQRFDRTIITSDSERNELLSFNPSLPIDVIPNGVDVEYFTHSDAKKHPQRVVFSGKMSYEPNAQAAIWFAKKVFPILKAECPGAEFVIVGNNPPAEVKKLVETLGICVTGFVDDIRPHMQSSSIAVVPMQVAVGIQNKILEAMAIGLPVVASPIATRPFGPNFPGIIEAETPEDTAREVIRLVKNPKDAAYIGCRGREEVLKSFSWQHSVDMLEKIYKKLLAR